MNSMTDMNKIFKILGGIQSDVSNIKDTTQNTEKKLDIHSEKIVELKMSNKSAHKRIDSHNVHIEDYKKLKQRGFGMATILGGIAGVVAPLAVKLVDKVFG